MDDRNIIDDFDEEDIDASEDPFHKILTRSDEKLRNKKAKKNTEKERE